MLGNKIKSIRLSLGMTLQQFGNSFDPPADKSLVSRWEKGINAPNNERIKKIVDLSGGTVDELIGTDIEQQIENMTLKELKRIARMYLEGE